MRKFFLISLIVIGATMKAGSFCGADIKIDTSSPFVPQEYSRRISMDFQDASLVDVLKIFSQQSQFNLVTSEALANKRVTVYLDNVPVHEALNQILKANSLTYEIQPDNDIYIVKPLAKPEVELITKVFPLRHSMVNNSKIKSLLKIEADEGQSGGGGGGAGGGAASGGDQEKTGITGAVKAILTDKGKVVEDPRTNSLIITDIASNFPMIESTIAKLDIAIPQILIEVEMLEVSKDTSNQIGIKIGDTPLVFSGGQRDHFYPWDQNRLLDSGNATFEDAQYRVGTIDASGLSATLQFLRTQTDTRNLARPRILTLDNETAQIKISTNEAIGIKDQQSSSENITTQSVEAERVETGVFLTVTPQVNTQTQEITMAIIPKVIIARQGATFSNTTFRDPEERASQSLLRVHSGDTIVIGGLVRSDNSNTVTKVPILGDIPLIGAAFRHKDKADVERELIIFITPHIVSTSPARKETAAKIRPITREQDAPSDKLQLIERELSRTEKKL
ncbi:MAG: secretin N-terminal domain-containing protein [Candidatus Omnitrophota bacterium]|nr:secretin N-terminal domain-containing protein [Candidatus Omnitrophota bacterium]MDZ4241221.1 secretin N-terminal domain-containing protein [Candidatus Omnitrophota bacterium]